MSVDNRTPFPALAFRQFTMAGDLAGIVVARGTFELGENGALRLAKEQMPLVMSDTYAGDPHASPQLACTDLAPFKPGTDVTFLGTSFAPDGVATPSWTCGLRVGKLARRLRVTGPRVWRAKTRRTWAGLVDRTKEWALDGWELTEPASVDQVSIDWSLAFGGTNGRESVEANPLGRGLVDDVLFQERPEWPAPQIEDADQPITEVTEQGTPAGMGLVSPFWQSRAAKAGTYDEAWVQSRHPLLPEDFDYRFWQAAAPGMVAEPWLQGDEDFELTNLLRGRSLLRGVLPGFHLHLGIDNGQGIERGWMVLDGVHFDMRPGVERVFLTWRANFPWPERRGMPVMECIRGEAEAA
ncbi:MAG: DUF2169 domain-containing protein [Mesorhizobium amorphae]|nr:MAG: DUF2169 domain-containing protein [Mesorhizobium amorphae]